MSIELPCLQGPLIQIGAYWGEIDETLAFRRVLDWILRRGYRMAPLVLGVKAEAGKLPRFLDMASGRGTLCFRDWSAEQALSSQDHIPVTVRLTPMNVCNVELDVSFAIMDAESFAGGDGHVIEIVASGADLDLVENVGCEGMCAEVVMGAKKTQKWCETTLRALCDELRPDYAGERWAVALQPPQSLVACEDPASLMNLYLSDHLEQAGQLGAQLAPFNVCTIVDHPHGVFVRAMDVADEGNTEVHAAAAVVREALRTQYCSV